MGGRIIQKVLPVRIFLGGWMSIIQM